MAGQRGTSRVSEAGGLVREAAAKTLNELLKLLGGGNLAGNIDTAVLMFLAREQELNAYAIISPANDFGIEGDGTLDCWLAMIGESDADNGTPIPPFGGENVHPTRTDVANAVGGWSAASKEVGDQAGQRLALCPARVRGLRRFQNALPPFFDGLCRFFSC